MATYYHRSEMLLSKNVLLLYREHFDFERIDLLVTVTAADKSVSRFNPAIFTARIFKQL